MRERLPLRSVVVGFGAAVALLLGVLAFVGVDDVLATARGVDPVAVVALLAVTALWVLAWGYSLSIVLAILGIDHTFSEALLLFGNVIFANSVAPSTYLGGEPLAALLVSRRLDADYETSLAIVAGVDLLNYAPMLPLAAVGLAYFAATAVLGRTVELALLAVLVGVVVLVAGAALAWRRRETVAGIVAPVLEGFSRALSRAVPGVRPASRITIGRRIDVLFDRLEQLSRDRPRLRRALAFSIAGWLLLATALWLSAYAVGHQVEPEIALFVVPLAAITNVLPLPGGVGSVDAVLILLLVGTAGVPTAAAAAAALIHRGATFWLPLLFGGGAVAAIQSDPARLPT